MKEALSKTVKEYLDKGNLWGIYQLYLNYGVESISKTLVRLGIQQENIGAYSSLAYLAQKAEVVKDKAAFHNYAGTVLTMGFAYLEGAYALACFHAIQAMENCPENIGYKQYFLRLFTEDLPDFEVEIETRKRVAQDILQIDPSDLLAREVLRRHG